MVSFEIANELPAIKTFSSLSPVTGFVKWLKTEIESDSSTLFTKDRELMKQTLKQEWQKDAGLTARIKKPLMKACAHYLINEKRNGKPINSVARFHFGNGAELYRINWMGNNSDHGLKDSFGIMVNYLYNLKTIESNHESYMLDNKLTISKSVKNLLG